MSDKLGKEYRIEIQILKHENAWLVEQFQCGNPSIDEYFRCLASDDEQAVTYLFIDQEASRLIACVTVACSAIFTPDVSDERHFSTIISAMEIKYFAVDDEYKHIKYDVGTNFTLSYYIFVYMLDYLGEVSHSTIGASKIVLYSVPEARSFYKRCHFKEFGDAMIGDEGYYVEGCIPMYYNLNGE